MTPQELAELIHEAHADLRFNGDLHYDFCFMYMSWHNTHTSYQMQLIAIAEQALLRMKTEEDMQ